MPQLLNAELIKNLAAHFILRNDPGFAIGQVLSTYTMLHGTRVSAFANFRAGNADQLYSIVPTIGFAIGGTPVLNQDNFLSYYTYDGGTARHSITGGVSRHTGISMITWVRFLSGSMGVNAAVISKWRPATNLRCFILRKTSADKMEFIMSDDGTNEFNVVSTETVLQDTWYLVACSFNPSTSINLFLSNPATKKLDKDTDTTGIPATLFDSATPSFVIMGDDPLTMLTNGDGAAFYASDKFVPDHQIKNAYQVARPLLGYK